MGQSPETRRSQHDAFWRLATFAARHSPFYARQEWARRLPAGSRPDQSEIPFLTKSDILDSGPAMVAAVRAQGHERQFTVHTSGSTGVPLEILKSVRQHHIENSENGPLKASWRLWSYASQLWVVPPTREHPFGECLTDDLPHRLGYSLYGLDAQLLANTIQDTQVKVVHTWPSIARGLIELCLAEQRELSIELLSTRAEVLSPDLRTLATQTLGCPVLDVYGCQEAGVLAVECGDCGRYHTADRSALVEVVLEDGSPAGPGQTGRVIVTPLHSYAMPMLRYEPGDIAVVAEPGGCDGGRISFDSVLGREKHLFIAPDGRRFAPMVSADRIGRLPLRQYKLIQLDSDTIEVQYVPRADRVVDEEALRNLVTDSIPAEFRVKCRSVPVIPPSASGKYIMHERLFEPTPTE